MFESIVIGYDGSDHSSDAVALGTLIAETTGADVTLARVFPSHAWGATWPDEREAEALEDVARDGGATARSLFSASPARGLHELAEETDTDLVVVGSSSTGRAGRVLAGTVAQRLLHGSPCAVAVAPAGFRERDAALRVIGLGYDGGPESRLALTAAIGLASNAQATLRIVMANPIAERLGPGTDVQEAVAEQLHRDLDEAVEAVPEELRPLASIVPGEPVPILVDEAEKGVDILCVGSRAYGPLGRVLLGSVAGELMETSPCPLLVVPRGGGD